jgi:hypothetical protein
MPDSRPCRLSVQKSSRGDFRQERLAAQHVPCEKEPIHNPTCQIHQALYRDPNGYLTEAKKVLARAFPLV